MVAITNILLVVAATTAAVLPRDAAQTLADLKTIDTQTNKLTSAVTSWDGTLVGALTISSDESTLENDITTAATDAKGAPTASSADSKAIVDYITGTLTPDIEASLNALSSAKSKFAAVSLTSTVESDLKSLKNKTDTLSTELVALSSSDQKAAGEAAASKIGSDFDAAIATFAS